MRPLSLTLKNIGPFKEQTIDFQELGDFFLICGKTGAGKTTIFDSMTYVLYGKLPGTRKKVDIKHLRSDFCSPEDEAFVSMNYILHGKSITVKRILPCLRVNRNGKITEKAEELTIYINQNGQEEAIQGKHTELNNYIEESIGLTADEFSRIVLLPQGEFADFLFQSSTQRAETLAKLFPVQKYENILQSTKEKLALLSADLTSIKNQLAEFGAEYNPDDEQKIIAEQESLLKKGSDELEQLKNKLVELQIKQNNLDSLIKKFDDETRLSQDLEKLVQQKNQIDEIQKRLDIANLVEPAAIACDEALREQDKLFRLQNDKEENQKQLDKIEQILLCLKEKENDYKENTKKYEQISIVLPELQNAVSLEQELETLKKEKTKKEEELNANAALIEKFQQEQKTLNEQLLTICSNKELNTEDLTQKIVELNSLKQNASTILAQAKEKVILTETLNDLQQQKEIETKELNKIKDLLDEARKKQNELQFNNFARSLSASLKKGCPCPVCGSKEHPAPHNAQLEFINDSDLYEQKILEENALLEKQQENQISKVAQIEGKLSQIQIQLEELKSVPSIDKADEKYLEIEKKYNQTLETNRTIQNIQNQLDKIQDSISEPTKILTELRIQKKGISTKIEEKEINIQKARKSIESFGLNNFSIFDSYNALFNLSNEIKKQNDDYQIKKQDAEIQHEKNKGINERLEQEILLAKQNADDSIQRRDNAMKKIGYANTEDLYKARLSSEQTSQMKQVVETWKNSYTQTNTLLEKIRSELTGTKELTEEQLSLVKTEIIETDEKQQVESAAINQAMVEKESRYQRLKTWNSLEQKRKNIQQDEALYRQLFNHINGINAKKTALTTWILGIYLDEITSYASNRLNRISEKRYTLMMNQENNGGNSKKGLDLEVLDAFTGKTRPCSTLSGGEVFMTSISLALALTDVVSNRAGGISLDAIFIDEGFGTLDETSLEQAMSVLDEIRDNRCVGLISHVAEMKNRIPTRLEVIKTPTGSTTKIIHIE